MCRHSTNSTETTLVSSDLIALGLRLATALPRLTGSGFAGGGYELPFAQATGGVCTTKDPLRRKIYDVAYGDTCLELSAGNVWLDGVRLARLLVQPPAERVVYGFLDRKTNGRRAQITRIYLADPVTLCAYLEIDNRRAHLILADAERAPSALNYQLHLNKRDVAAASVIVVEWQGLSPVVRALDEPRLATCNREHARSDG